MVSMAGLIGSDTLIRQVGGPAPAASAQRISLARTAPDPDRTDNTLLVVPGDVTW